MYGDFVPIEFTANESFYTCFLPSTLEVTDFREINTIIGFECKMTLTSINDFQEIIGLKDATSFLVGSLEEFNLRSPMAFVVGNYSTFSINNSMGFVIGELPSKINLSSTLVAVLGKENLTE